MKIMSFFKPRLQDAPGELNYPPVNRHRGQFRFNTISALLILMAMVLGVVLQGMISPTQTGEAMVLLVFGSLAGSAVLFLMPFWPAVILVIAGIWAVPLYLTGTIPLTAVLLLSSGFFLAPGIEIIDQWDKIVVLRLGKFSRVRGPGLMYLVPLIDTVAGYVDTRIRVTDFSAEKSLTLDTVPVHVDALAFWMIWDAEKAVLEVQDFQAAVSLSAQTALRSCIGSNSLTALLSERERLGEEIQQMVDAKTNPWGITIISVEFKEILIPEKLEDALSREAQAVREKAARVILGGAEAEIAGSYRRAADVYRDDPAALQLRAMNMIYESVRNKGGLVLAPASALDGMNLGTVLGAAVWGDHTGAIPDIRTGGPTRETVPKAGEETGIDEDTAPGPEEGEAE
jgi:regulator of protease activity HflC (stomatin/prohibitin superfamily)